MTGLSNLPADRVRLGVEVTGLVQGVGFRPAVARIADRHGVSGFVRNDFGSVRCEFEGDAAAVAAAVEAVGSGAPPLARVDAIRLTELTPRGGPGGFSIVTGLADGGGPTLIPPDIATCTDCLQELFDPDDRRCGHPFISCVNCGPRYTVITGLPYDRDRTSMVGFPMCPKCATEYGDPRDRRYHAQTIACPECGPTLWWSGPGDGADPVAAAVAALRSGLIVAVKGIGGYHLACRAADDSAVDMLRRRKKRPAKPFALMVADVDGARAIAGVDDRAARALTSPAAPIVLVPRCGDDFDAVAPGLAELGVMVAYTPLHHLLFHQLGDEPLIMTSANAGGSPIVHRDDDLGWLDGIADAVLGHDRPIHVPCEDSVLAAGVGHALAPVRRSRGFAPLPVIVAAHPTGNSAADLDADTGSEPMILATGGDVKSAFCLLDREGRAFLSPHLGDMADPRTRTRFEATVHHAVSMAVAPPTLLACDRHPRYATTAWAHRSRLRTIAVQHHHAHAVALLAEHRRLSDPIVAVTYDGTGYGTDGTIWGGEVLLITEPARFTRVGHLATFALPGGDGAIRQPARIALELLHRAGVDWDPALAPVRAVGADGIHILSQQIPRAVGCVPTTSMGRLFDAIASLLDIRQAVTYEGQAAVELEHLARRGRPVRLDFTVDAGVMDPAPVIVGVVDLVRAGCSAADVAAGFHAAVARATAAVAADCARAAGITTIGLTGGVFANRLLTRGVVDALRADGFEVLTHQAVPCNDGGLALGQAVIAAASLNPYDGERSDRCA